MLKRWSDNVVREYKEYYVAVIDLLGFKNTINNETCETICGFYDEIYTEYVVTDERIKKPVVEEKTVKMKVASDTIFLYVEADVHNALAGLIAYCDYLQVRLLRQKIPVLSRGAITKGKVYIDGDVCFGPAIVEAYKMEEELAKSPRIIMSKEIIDQWEKYDQSGKGYIDMFTFQDVDGYIILDYLYLFYGLNHNSNPSVWNKFAVYAKEKASSEKNVSVKMKYQYIYNQFTRVTKKYLQNFGYEL